MSMMKIELTHTWSGALQGHTDLTALSCAVGTPKGFSAKRAFNLWAAHKVGYMVGGRSTTDYFTLNILLQWDLQNGKKWKLRIDGSVVITAASQQGSFHVEFVFVLPLFAPASRHMKSCMLGSCQCLWPRHWLRTGAAYMQRTNFPTG